MKKIKLRTKESYMGISFLSIGILGFTCIYIYPFILSLFNIDVKTVEQLVGSNTFWLALRNTFKFAVIAIPLLLIISFMIALTLEHLYINNKILYNVFIFFHLFPMIVPSFIVSFVFKIFFSDYGIINGLLDKINVGRVYWLNSEISLILLIIIYIWKYYGYGMVIILGGLRSVEKSTIEAARVDGAGKLSILFKIRIPQIKSYIIFVIMMEVVNMFKVFRESSILFGDYPHSSIYMIQNYMNNSMNSLNYTKLSCASIILIFFFTIFVLGVLKFSTNKE